MSNVSAAGEEMAARWEGYSAHPYLCPAGVWTIGYGTTKGVTRNTPPISRQEALALLRHELRWYANMVLRLTHVPLAQGQLDALASFAYNVGTGAYQRSTLRQRLNRGDYQGAAEQFSRWVFAGGRKLPGLVARRAEEAAMFQRDIDLQAPPMPLPWLVRRAA